MVRFFRITIQGKDKYKMVIYDDTHNATDIIILNVLPKGIKIGAKYVEV